MPLLLPLLLSLAGRPWQVAPAGGFFFLFPLRGVGLPAGALCARRAGSSALLRFARSTSLPPAGTRLLLFSMRTMLACRRQRRAPSEAEERGGARAASAKGGAKRRPTPRSGKRKKEPPAGATCQGQPARGNLPGAKEGGNKRRELGCDEKCACACAEDVCGSPCEVGMGRVDGWVEDEDALVCVGSGCACEAKGWFGAVEG